MEKYYINNDNNRVENPCLTPSEGKKRVRRGEEEGKKRLRRGREEAWHDESRVKDGLKRWLWLKVLRVAVVLGVMMGWEVSETWGATVTYHIINLGRLDDNGQLTTSMRTEALRFTSTETTVGVPDKFKSPLATNWQYYSSDDVTFDEETKVYTFISGPSLSVGDEVSDNAHVYVTYELEENNISNVGLYNGGICRIKFPDGYYLKQTVWQNEYNTGSENTNSTESIYLWKFNIIDPYQITVQSQSQNCFDYYLCSKNGNFGDIRLKATLSEARETKVWVFGLLNGGTDGTYRLVVTDGYSVLNGYTGSSPSGCDSFGHGYLNNYDGSNSSHKTRYMKYYNSNTYYKCDLTFVPLTKTYIILNSSGETLVQATTTDYPLEVPDVIKSPFATYSYYSDAACTHEIIAVGNTTTIYVRYTTTSSSLNLNGGTEYYVCTNNNYWYAANPTTIGIANSFADPTSETKWTINGNDAYQLTIKNVGNNNEVTYDVSSGEAVPTLSATGSKFFLHQSNTGQYEVVAVTSGDYTTGYYSMGVANNTLKLYSNSSYPMGQDEVQSVFLTQIACAKPVIAFDYTTGQVTISSATLGATIHYTTDGTEPTTSSQSTPNPFTINSTTTIKAIAVKTGFDNSEKAERTFEQVAPLIIQNNNNAVSITCDTEGVTIYYTTDGSIPTTSSTQYTIPLTENVSGVLIKAIAVKENMVPAEGSNTVTLQCATPVITRVDMSFTLSCSMPTDATLYYTLNGGSEIVYSGAAVSFTASQLPMTVTAVARHSDYTQSETATMQLTSGTGTPTDPYLIYSVSDFNAFVTNVNNGTTVSASYRLMANLSVSGTTAINTTFTGTFDGNFHKLTNLGHPIFNTINGGTVKNLMLKDVSITGSGNTGAICNEATGASRIFNCGILPSTITYNAEGVITATGSTVASTNGCCGSLVGKLENSSRVINCFSYAFVTGGTTVAGIVGDIGNTEIKQDNVATVPMVVNCMFYGDITGGTTKCPVYGGAMIKNNRVNGVNPYDYFRENATFDEALPNIDSYKRSWPANEEYLTRFEYYRSILNSNRQLMAWWVSGNIADTALIAKWVLDPEIAPYPVLKKWGKYPSIINPDPTKTWDSEANNGAGGWQTRSSAASYRGKSFGTLNVTVKTGSHPGDAGMTGISVINNKPWPLTITDMDTLNYDYGYYKVQLPYYNEVFGNPSETNHIKRYYGNYTDKVVTGWKITNITGGVEGVTNLPGTDANGMAYDHRFDKNWETGYNFADRYCTDKDKFDVSGRVFAQGGFFYVPEGVTAITIEAYWGKAVYLHNTGHYLDRVNITASSGDRTVGNAFNPTGMTTLDDTFQGQTVYDAWHTAVTNLDEATVSGSGDNKKLSLSVYEQAIVLLSNYQLRNEDGNVGTNITDPRKWYPYTIMSIDQDLDNEPDYCFEFQFRKQLHRRGIQPIRFDFLPVPELGLAVRHDKNQNTIGIFIPLGHFEITETSYMHTTQFEYDAQSTTGSGYGEAGPKVPAPIILNGGHFEQIVARYDPVQNTTQYFLMGGHFRMLRFTPGAHTNRGQNAKIRLCAVNAIGGEYPEFYLSGIYRPDITPTSIAAQGNPHCYTNGGKFGIVAGAGYDKILGSVTFEIDHSIIREFYGGGINGSKPVGGSIDVTIDHSLVLDKYCGGPKVGPMSEGKTVTTYARGTVFNKFYGGGNGGTSYYREQGHDGNVPMPSADSTGWADIGSSSNGYPKYKEFNPLNTRTGGSLAAAYDDTSEDKKGYHGLYEFECFVESNGLGGNPTLRTYTHWAQFGTTSTGNITTFLDNCTVKKSFYGGGNLGNVNGTVTSTLKDCTILENVFGGGFSSAIEPFRIHDKGQTHFPYIDKAGIMQNGSNGTNSCEYLKNADGTDRYYTWSNAPGHEPLVNPTFQGEDGKWYVYTTVSLEGLGEVSSNVDLTLKGNTTVGHTEGNSLIGGNVYGGGDMSAVNGNATVTITGNAEVKGNVFGGGNAASVGVVTSGTPGNTTVKLQQGARVLGNVYGGGNEGPVGGNSEVIIKDP